MTQMIISIDVLWCGVRIIWLTGVLGVFVDRSFLESFNTTFIGNIKKLSRNQFFFFFFPHKKFLKIFSKPMHLGHPLTFP